MSQLTEISAVLGSNVVTMEVSKKMKVFYISEEYVYNDLKLNEYFWGLPAKNILGCNMGADLWTLEKLMIEKLGGAGPEPELFLALASFCFVNFDSKNILCIFLILHFSSQEKTLSSYLHNLLGIKFPFIDTFLLYAANILYK